MPDVFLLQIKEDEQEEEEPVVEDRFLFESGVPAANVYYARESAESRTLFRSAVTQLVQRDFLLYDTKRKDVGYLDGTITLIASDEARLSTVI